MDFQKFTDIITSHNRRIYCDFNIKEVTLKKKKTFLHSTSLKEYLNSSIYSNKTIYFTLDKVEDFELIGESLVINYNAFQIFCNDIWKSWENKAKAFFKTKIRDYTEDEKKNIRLESNESDILEIIREFTKEQKQNFINNLQWIEDINFPKDIDIKNFSGYDFVNAFSELAKNPEKQNLIISNYPKIQIEVLEQHKKFLEKNLDKDETFIQNWLDGKIDDDWNSLSKIDDEIKAIRKSRCLIFWLEYINHIREWVNSSKRIDVLTKFSENKNEYVIFELKSPNMEVFKIKEVENLNWWRSTEYHLSKWISRSLPQILRYKDNLNDKPAEDEDWQKMWIAKGKVSKCIILIWTKKDGDKLWENHFLSLKNSLSSSVEIITYSDLIDKIDTTIKNLKDNLN